MFSLERVDHDRKRRYVRIKRSSVAKTSDVLFSFGGSRGRGRNQRNLLKNFEQSVAGDLWAGKGRVKAKLIRSQSRPLLVAPVLKLHYAFSLAPGLSYPEDPLTRIPRDSRALEKDLKKYKIRRISAAYVYTPGEARRGEARRGEASYQKRQTTSS